MYPMSRNPSVKEPVEKLMATGEVFTCADLYTAVGATRQAVNQVLRKGMAAGKYIACGTKNGAKAYRLAKPGDKLTPPAVKTPKVHVLPMGSINTQPLQAAWGQSC